MKHAAKFFQLEMLSVLFITAPLFIFVSQWITATYAAVLILGLLFLFGKHLSDPIQSKGIEIEWKYFFLLFILAFIWVYFSGIGGYTYQNGDWKKHYALFHDLVYLNWPIVHNDPLSSTGQSFLVYYFGYYLVPSIVGKLFSWDVMTAFLMPYTAFGITLGFYWLRILTGHKSLLLVFLFTWTSGLDIIGWLIMKGYWPEFQQHLEWWSGNQMQYSGTTNLLFWVPQQALAAWVGFPLLLHTLEKQKYELASLTTVSMPIWSPFVCIGVAPFVVWKFIRSRPDFRKLLMPAVMLISFVVIFYYFFESSMNNMSAHFALYRIKTWQDWKGLILFHFLEYLIFFIALYFCWTKKEWKKHRAFFVIALVMLFFIPLRESRMWNDWTMRVSIPPLYIMWVFLLQTMFSASKRSLTYTIIGFLLIIGSITSFKEYERSVDWLETTRRELYDVETMTKEFFDSRFKTQYFSPGDGKFHQRFSSHND